jgi:predicted dehydrogenase
MRIAIFGLGSIGSRHARNLIEMGEHELAAFDPCISSVAFNEFVSSLSLIGEQTAMWDWKPEAVLICTPPATHYALITQALEHDCHVFCEKPLVSHAFERIGLEQQIHYARTRGVQVAVGYQLRWAMKEFYDHVSGSDIHFTCSQDMSTWPSRYTKDVLEEFSHEIDAAVLFNGPVSTVVAKQYGPVWGLSLQHQRYFSRILIHPSSATVVRYAQSDSGELWTFDPACNEQAYKDELREFLAVCSGKAWSHFLCPGAEAAHVCRIIEACRESARDCRVVRL